MADLSVTALYTSQVWAWGHLSHAELLATPDGKRVFDATNAALSMARLVRRDMPDLRYALLHRHAMIDHLLEQATDRRVIELAAGLSRRGAANCHERDYTEIDLPPVIAKKRELLARTPDGREILEHLQLVGGDVADVALTGPAFVIAEGLLVYLSHDARTKLFAKARAAATAFVFDLVPASEEPQPGAIGRALEAGMKLFTGGKSFERDAKDRAQIERELNDAGFATVTAYAARDVADAWHLPFPDERSNTLVWRAS
ncbi:MAG TPA: class I SAM-dependent methyltransferase [Kofleriaceae bacterium]|nr:class I SAM-dependent methyltransferase [Kofleriaceae bacterium]